MTDYPIKEYSGYPHLKRFSEDTGPIKTYFLAETPIREFLDRIQEGLSSIDGVILYEELERMIATSVSYLKLFIGNETIKRDYYNGIKILLDPHCKVKTYRESTKVELTFIDETLHITRIFRSRIRDFEYPGLRVDEHNPTPYFLIFLPEHKQEAYTSVIYKKIGLYLIGDKDVT